ncbi:MAG: S8 family serine peptidase [Flavobacteriales bacterium]|nr:S8 family serine peptidase [Flavobacteriales bacterium]
MKQILYLTFVLFIIPTYSQQKYWIFFEDKSDTTGVPSGFNEHAIKRRISQNIQWESSDYPLNTSYIKEIHCKVDSLGYESRWLNAVAAWVQPDSLPKLFNLPFVKKIECIESQTIHCTQKAVIKKQASELKKLADEQINLLGASLLQSYRLDGNNIRICIIDAGFWGANFTPGLKHVYQRNGIASTFDFIRGKEDVYTGSVHGTYVFSCMAGKTESLQTGLATGATYLLARTESVWSENQAEEDRWIAALEWADRQGAHIINCSMGYTRPKYKKSDLNGTSRLSQAMNMAADKGMLVINAAGNEYNNSWKTLILPADADKVLTVGAIHPFTGRHAWYSSVGPTADGRIKPELTAPGTVVAWGKKNMSVISGTSFSAPMIGGLAACIWQFFTDTLTSSELKKLLVKSGCWWPFYDYRLGYGLPVTQVLFPKKLTNNSWEISTNNKQLTIQFSKPMEEEEKIFYKIDKHPGEFEVYGFIQLAKGASQASFPWENIEGNVRKKIKEGKSYTGKTLWIKWRDMQQELVIP